MHPTHIFASISELLIITLPQLIKNQQAVSIREIGKENVRKRLKTSLKMAKK